MAAKTLHERFREAFEESGLTMRGLARASGEHPSVVSNLLAGKARNTRDKAIYNYAHALRVNGAWLMFGTGPKQPAPGAPHSVYTERSARALNAAIEYYECSGGVPFSPNTLEVARRLAVGQDRTADEWLEYLNEIEGILGTLDSVQEQILDNRGSMVTKTYTHPLKREE